MTEYINALMVCLQPINLLLIVAMVSLGIVFGAIPGLSATLGIALLLPVTFGLSTETSFVLLLAPLSRLCSSVSPVPRRPLPPASTDFL